MSVSEGVLQGQLSHKCSDIATEYKFLQLDTSECDSAETVVELADAGGKIFGISASSTAAVNRAIVVNTKGECFLTVNGNSVNISAGDRLKSAANGVGIKADTDHDECGAVALEGATADGVNIKVCCIPFSLYEVG